jgi:hypothetical protein
MNPKVVTTFGKPMLVSTIFNAAKGSGAYYKEEPQTIGVWKRDGFKSSNSLAGLIYCVVTNKTGTYILVKVNGEVVAESYLEALIWVVENAPVSLKAGVAALIEYEKVAA